MSVGANIYRIICLEEGTIYVFTTRLTSEGPPTLCPNDHANRTNITDVRLIGTISPQQTTVLEPTTGIFEAKSWKYAIALAAPGTVTNNIIVFPFTIQVWQTAVQITAPMVGDQLSICVAPGAVIGLLTVAVSSGVVLDVGSLTVYNSNVNVGCVIELFDGVNTQNVGYLTYIDQALFQLKIEIPVAFSFGVGTQVRMYNYLIRDYELSDVAYRKFGSKGFRSRTIPSGTPVQVSYRNVTGTAKHLVISSELYKS